MLDPALDEYEAGKYSPAYLSQEDLEPGSIVITEAEDLSKLNVDQVFFSNFELFYYFKLNLITFGYRIKQMDK